MYTRLIVGYKYLFFYLKYETNYLRKAKLIVVTTCCSFLAYKSYNIGEIASLKIDVP